MIQWQASFIFEAETVEEAKEIVGAWTVTPGVSLMALQGSINVINVVPQPILLGGPVAPAFASNDLPIPPPTVVEPSGYAVSMPSRQMTDQEMENAKE